MKRKLASLQKIEGLTPIAGKDRIELARVLGWNVIVGKGLYNVGDEVCYFEIDSVIPEEWGKEYVPELESRKWRIKTFSVGSDNGTVYSQGFCIPIDKFWEILKEYNYGDYKDIHFGIIKLHNGGDVTDMLGVTKYELPDNMVQGDMAGSFPTHILSVTDEMRLQACMDVLEEMKGKPYVIRTKIDGTSWTALRDSYGTGNDIVCSRNNMKKNPALSGKPCSYWEMYTKYDFNKIFAMLPQYAFQGEMYGEGIQKNPLQLKGRKLAIFNIIDIPTRRRLHDAEMRNICDNLGLDLCPEYGRGYAFDYTLEDLVTVSMHKYPSGKDAEGIVIRPTTQFYSTVLNDWMSFKVINPKFLLKKGE